MQAESGQPVFVIEEVSVERVRPLRLEYLRPGRSTDAVEYKSDECPTCRHFAALDEAGAIVGVASMHADDRVAGRPPFGRPGMRLRGVAVQDDWRGRGVGNALVARMLECAVEAGMDEAWANARTASRNFYGRNGFVEMSQPFDMPTLGEHVVVALSLAKRVKKARKAGTVIEGQDADATGA